MYRLATGTIVGVTLVLQLLQRAAFGRQFDHLEFEQEHLPGKQHRHVDATVAGYFQRGVQA